LRRSRIVRGLSTPLSYVAGIAIFVGVYETLHSAGYLPPWMISLSVETTEPFNLTSFALSLLLVFRTNSSYSRWLDARKIWGGIVNRSRDMARQVGAG
jgi:ion channel-forming bestrophin family protein